MWLPVMFIKEHGQNGIYWISSWDKDSSLLVLSVRTSVGFFIYFE